MVPNGWSNTCIDDNITFSGGAQPPREVFKFEPEEGYIRLIQIRDYKSDKFITYVPKKLAKKFCTADDVMIGRYGPPIFQILRGIEGAYNVALIKAIPKSGVDKEFMYYFLKRDPLLKVIESFSQRTSGQTGIEMDVLKAYPMHLPPLPEQRKIAQILSTWDKAITTTEKLIDASKQQKKALMQQLLTGKKRLVDPDTGKAFEGEWEEVKLGDLGKTFTGLTGKTKEHFGRGSKYIPYINIFRNSSVDMNALELVDVRPNEKQNLVKYGDIFFTTSSETPEEVGMSSVILEEIDESVYLNSFCFGFRPHNFNRVKPEFIRYLLRSEKVRRSISLLAQGATRYNLSKTQLLKITLNIPSLGEQQKIASVLTAADKDIELLEAKLAHFKQEKKALMQQLLTGKRRVKVAETEAA
ncbi:restriction endonuclease subunit S [Vibrio cincinnatiensis]|uniref:restriction endonuclease subunit S n=1 Tax=Vibrio cincinnatiensis TaxID=675 RepID=UPI001EDF9940|nr:restriction endonuclease subunit S [Vibrio cincinnatiensis]MCG3763527.1 restriction endonuclease subunit S [Vibrio cincinnatiensis]